ncbi:MAG: 50S ribosomal protein L28 [Candidatus Magasanikbacteria bacterium]|nr:50S ribosomal protein L28 [Candidatus Magasanikbacteria bacterium]
MSRSCDLCGKSAVRANHVSHSNIKVPRRQKPNLQLLTVSGKTLKACSSCRRTLAKQLA